MITYILLIIIVGLSAAVIFLLTKNKTVQTSTISTSPDQIDSLNNLAPEASLRDMVTGLYNRKHLIQRLTDTMARADRENKTVALILWDIDGFVQFNNRYGQKEGDKFLIKVATTVKKALRTYDEAFRSGADEFCALLIPADQMISDEVTKRVNQMVSKELFEDDSDYKGQEFSISSGAVFYPGENKIPEAILHAAKQALYKSRLVHSQG